MTPNKFAKEDDYYLVQLPKSEWPNIGKWFGSNVSLTSIVLTELSKIKKTKQNGPRKMLRLGIPTIDAMIGGVSTGEILYIGNEEEQCNVAFGLNIIQNLAIHRGKRMLVFNSGRGEYAYARALIGLCAKVDTAKLNNPKWLSDEQWQQIEEATERIQRADVSIVNMPNLCVESLCDEVIKLEDTDRPDVILIDNLRFLTTRKECDDRQQEYCLIAQTLWKLAKETGIPIVLSGPLSKRRKKMCDYWPTACDMPADNMLDSFDKIVMVHRCGEPDKQNILNVTVVKNPDGTYGYRELEYDSNYNELKEILVQGKDDACTI